MTHVQRRVANSTIHILFFAGMAAFAFFLYTISQVENMMVPSVQAVNGKVHADWVAEPGLVSLEGDWEFYPRVLLSPDAFATDIPDPQIQTIPVPWPMKRPLPQVSPSDGRLPVVPPDIATYRVLISGLPSQAFCGFFVRELASSYKVFANGVLVMECGRVSDNKDLYQPLIAPRSSLFNAKNGVVDLVIQVADHSSSFGGLWQKVYFGDARSILELHQGLATRDIFFLSGLIMMAAYQWILFFIMKRDRATMFLALFCSTVVVKSLYSEMMFGTLWFPFVSYNTAMLLAYLMVISIPPLFLAYMRQCFPAETPKILIFVSLGLALVQGIVVCVTPFGWYQAHFEFYQGAILLQCGIILVLIIRALMHKRQAAGLLFAGYVSLVVTAVNDILFSNFVIKTGFLLNVGLYFFFLAQSAMTAIRYRSALETVEDLSRDLETRVADRTRELEAERNAYARLAREDSLTGLFNKRYLNETLDTEFNAWLRYGQYFSVLLIDLDHFKEVNDTHGHLYGDRLLVGLAQMLRDHLRKSDICGRFGGDEFMVMLRSTGLQEAMTVAENLRNHAIATGVTISIGVASVGPGCPHASALVQHADAGLYDAKAAGRNRVCTRTVLP